MESIFHFLTSSEPALRGEVAQLTRPVGQLDEKVPKIRHRCTFRVEYVLFEHDGRQLHLTRQLYTSWAFLNSLKGAGE